jgi:hypothetical protein
VRILLLFTSAVLLLQPPSAAAAGRNPWTHLWADDVVSSALPRPASLAEAARAAPAGDAQVAAPRVAAFEYSDAYRMRAKIHKLASFATLPLFATEVVLGQSIYNETSEGRKSAHVAVGAGIGALFGVNTVTGVWNMWEARKDPNGRKRRMVHGLLMLAADAGFAITPMVAPDRSSLNYDSQRSTHRSVALTSIGIATAGYLTMLIGR